MEGKGQRATEAEETRAALLGRVGQWVTQRNQMAKGPTVRQRV